MGKNNWFLADQCRAKLDSKKLYNSIAACGSELEDFQTHASNENEIFGQIDTYFSYAVKIAIFFIAAHMMKNFISHCKDGKNPQPFGQT